MKRVNEIPGKMAEIMRSQSTRGFLDQIARTTVNKFIVDADAATSYINQEIDRFKPICDELKGYREKVMHLFGKDDTYSRCLVVEKDINNIIYLLDDIGLHVLKGDIRNAYRRQELDFQTEDL